MKILSLILNLFKKTFPTRVKKTHPEEEVATLPLDMSELSAVGVRSSCLVC